MKTIITKKELIALVKGEATKLKAAIDKGEANLLDFTTLNGDQRHLCIYGQMTGDCYSGRAKDLINESCEKVFYKDGSGKIDGALCLIDKEDSRHRYWSPIETFIYKNENRDNGNNERLVKFLKGETKKLILK